MFIRHHVADYARWKPVFDEHETARRGAGFTGHDLYREADDPNGLIIAFEVSDVDRAREFAGSDELRTAMERAGVQGPPEIWFADGIEGKRYQ